MTTKLLFIRAEWDEEASVWVATSDDVPGLATEEARIEALIAKLKIVIPELLDANGIHMEQGIPFEVMTRCADGCRATIRAADFGQDTLKPRMGRNTS